MLDCSGDMDCGIMIGLTQDIHDELLGVLKTYKDVPMAQMLHLIVMAGIFAVKDDLIDVRETIREAEKLRHSGMD